ncbi:N-6 DNA methylase [Xanthomonas hortorum]|uniref:N-6 DNA methylase n=1 Tax=Xanthomonas hortorum TaxID=56454 RepID=UPI0003D3789A|nr:N-6 DNA methylase [Xanthomonas hortorum]ETC86065.1 type I restriction enzyme [Xanthomonas hortorum pv. carotae str. M081]MCE4360271.1 N-6 DNA methylase [Xanthomonas hortorum pv. taraxaci]NMI53625.1 type I restriction endonuclease subunit M [Xanthomonas hortorum pv. taraxaci]
MTSVKTETETVIKRILPYLRRREYVIEADVDFETKAKSLVRYTNGYVDLLVNCGDSKPKFIIEAKRTGKKLTDKDRHQALEYGKSIKVAFVVVTNGQEIQCFNTQSGEAIRWDGYLQAKIPSKSQLKFVLAALKKNPALTDVPLSKDSSLPFRPALPLKQLNALFQRCHGAIRKIEKNEENAFADFSKILFLKLLEEKSDRSSFPLPYSYRFHDLAARPKSEADQVMGAVRTMITDIGKDPKYGDVLGDPIRLKQPATFHKIVSELASVSFEDSGLDTKGAAFEYFVRATLKGKKLGQYFTPRPLVELMVALVNVDAIIASAIAGNPVKFLDPACGTGGFLVYTMKEALLRLETQLASKKLTNAHFEVASSRIREEVFYGADANEGVAAAAKMNMIIAGDGHSNVRAEDTLRKASKIWTDSKPFADYILTNPPFGTSESESLPADERLDFGVASTKGQHLFLDKMVRSAGPGALICTVIDDGVLNTDSAAELRKLILEQCDLEVVLSLPDDTFKPNKINVRSSVLLLRKKASRQADPTQDPIRFITLDSLGYDGSGDAIRGFDFFSLRRDFETVIQDRSVAPLGAGNHWSYFDVPFVEVWGDKTKRWDVKYWRPEVREACKNLAAAGVKQIADLNLIPTSRGKSPPADTYVDESDGHALVVKAGSNVTNAGFINLTGADYVEKIVFDDLPESCKLIKGDVVLSSTGEGTLGKCAVFDLDIPALGDGHVTIIRTDPGVIDSYYLCDYLRVGFGADQVNRLFTGSTGLIELSPDRAAEIFIEVPGSIVAQRAISDLLRSGERQGESDLSKAKGAIQGARGNFKAAATIPASSHLKKVIKSQKKK